MSDVWEEATDVEVEELEEPKVCPVGIHGHEWQIGLDWGELFITSRCEICDLAIDTSYLMLASIKGRIVTGQDHPDLGGWHGLTRCDCNWWFEFIPRFVDGSAA